MTENSEIQGRYTQFSKLKIATNAFINGRYVPALSGKTMSCISPINGQQIAEIAACSKEDIDMAVSAARASFNRGHWSNIAPADRKKTMLKFAALINDHLEELALLETLDMGKPISNSINVDIPAAANSIAWYGELADKLNGEIAPTDHHALGMITREPIGVVAAVVPWNFPLLMACWKLGPALATGNSVILKPSEKSPLTALRIAELASQAGIPDGVLNVVSGTGPEAGEPLALHEDVDCLAFTGSTTIGKRMLELSGRSNMKKVWLECGGKSPNIIFSDCLDHDAVANAAAWAVFYNQGEMCSAGSRLIIHCELKELILEKIIAIAKSIKVDNPLKSATQMGAIVDDIQLDRIISLLSDGKKDGAELRFGGQQILQETGGYYLQPTIFETGGDIEIARTEIFGPVLSVLEFNSVDEAIHMANDSIYGLAAAVWTQDINKAHICSRALKAGTVWVNCYEEGNMSMPFGGFKLSGHGRDKSIHAIDKYTELKSTWIKLGL